MTKREIDICICTFQRPHILETLQSIAAMKANPDWAIHVIIADNDETPSSRKMIEAKQEAFPYPLTYIHAPSRNISIARNACLDKAKAPLVAFIDDDEIVSQNWLVEMVTRMEDTKAQAILGPVKAIYQDQCPTWIKEGDYHSNYPAYVDGKITTGYTGNLLFNQTAKPFKNKRFRLELGQTGGEDSMFFKEAYLAGAKIEYAPRAFVTEVIPHERATFSWLAQRRFREGQTHGMMIQEVESRNPFTAIKNIALAAAKSGFSFLVAPFFLPWRHRMNFWLFRGAMHAGVVAHLVGKNTLVQYGHNLKETTKSV